MITSGSKKGLAATDLAAKASATLAAKVAAAQVVEGVPTTSKYRSNLVVVGHCKCFRHFFLSKCFVSFWYIIMIYVSCSFYIRMIYQNDISDLIYHYVFNIFLHTFTPQ